MQRDLSDLYDRMTGAALHQQTRIRREEARGAADLFLILPFPVLPRLREKERGGERECLCVCVCERESVGVRAGPFRLFLPLLLTHTRVHAHTHTLRISSPSALLSSFLPLPVL